MAASSVGRRSCAGQREAAALISQSRRWFYRRVKRAAVRRLFSLPSSGSKQMFNFQYEKHSKTDSQSARLPQSQLT